MKLRGFFLLQHSVSSVSGPAVCLRAFHGTVCPAVPAPEVRKIAPSESSLYRKAHPKGHSSGRTLSYRHVL